MIISGTNIMGEWKSDIQSYHFSYYGGIWGWASWRRAWKYYDVNMILWLDSEIKNRVKDVLANDRQYQKREINFNETFNGKIDAWDYQWGFARLTQSGLSIVPARNLISNIGFGNNATHTKSSNSKLAKLPLLGLNFPMKFNKFVAVDREYDKRFFETHEPTGVGKAKRILSRISRILFTGGKT